MASIHPYLARQEAVSRAAATLRDLPDVDLDAPALRFIAYDDNGIAIAAALNLDAEALRLERARRRAARPKLRFGAAITVAIALLALPYDEAFRQFRACALAHQGAANPPPQCEAAREALQHAMSARPRGAFERQAR